MAGASIDVINAMAFNFNYRLNNENIIAPNQITSLLAAVLKSILEISYSEIPDYLSKVKIDDEAAQLAKKLSDTDNSVIILGEHAVNNPQASSVAKLIAEIAKQTNSTTLNLTATANSNAANMANFIPEKGGLDTNAMLAAGLNAYILLDIYPQYDFHNSVEAIKALNNEKTFVISINSFKDSAVEKYSNVILPMAAFYETSGSHVNVEGRVQTFAAAIGAPGEAKPAWKILKVLADLLELPGFHYADSTQITSEVAHQSYKQKACDAEIDITVKRGITVIWQKSPYAIDVLSRYATSLQATKIGQINSASMNQATFTKLELSAETPKYLGVPVVVTEAVADNCVFVNANKATGGE
ncbi:NADH-ubiquinone oxidoreductase chain G [uncultured Candidatus Thioglobus sp.]|nr:NADH-ubiquinone oxidoreductase chain G [uncultured Candidatus Thioglobus sp.]